VLHFLFVGKPMRTSIGCKLSNIVDIMHTNEQRYKLTYIITNILVSFLNFNIN